VILWRTAACPGCEAQDADPNLGIVACDVVQGEIERVLDGRIVPVKVLDFALHERPV
jgi:hypothetical protein